MSLWKIENVLRRYEEENFAIFPPIFSGCVLRKRETLRQTRVSETAQQHRLIPI